MKTLAVIGKVLICTFIISSLMFWSWSPETTDPHGFFLFWAWIFSMLFIGGYEVSRHAQD